MYRIEKAKTPFSHLKGKIIFDSNFSEIPSNGLIRSCFQKNISDLGLSTKIKGNRAINSKMVSTEIILETR